MWRHQKLYFRCLIFIQYDEHLDYNDVKVINRNYLTFLQENINVVMNIM